MNNLRQFFFSQIIDDKRVIVYLKIKNVKEWNNYLKTASVLL